MSALNRLQITWRAAQDIDDHQVVNLGIGLPVHCSDYLRPEVDVILQSENGVIGVGALPLTAVRCVSRVYTDLAVVDVTPQGFVVHEMVEMSREELQGKTGAALTFAADCKTLTAPPIALPESK